MTEAAGHGKARVSAPGKQRILVVDDEPANRHLLQMILSRGDFGEVRAIGRPEEVVPTCLEFEPDIVLLDLHLPGRDGFDVLAEMDSLPNRELLPVVMITGDPDRSVRQRALERGAKDFIAKPFDNVEIVLRVRNLLETRQLQVELKARNLVLEEEVSERTAELTKAIERLSRSEAELQLAQRETIERLGMAAEFHDYETATHIRRMSTYCGMLARWADLDERLAGSIEVASGLHDVGKIGIPDSILRKPGPLTEDEMNLMREHTVIGNRILTGSKSEVIERAALIALTHHERPDGSGYPNGLRGREIPIEGCIAAIADVFDALTSDRVYRPAISVEDSLRMMEEGRGSQFDAELLDLFFEHISEVLAARSL